MDTKPFDSDGYKEKQRKDWDGVAIGWEKWWKTFEQSFQVITDRMLESAKIHPGYRVLDIATGIGEPAITAAQRVGSSGYVVAVDQSSQMLKVARKRAADLEIKNLDFHEMDGENLDFIESSFDVILCRLGLMFLPNVKTTMRRINQLLVQNGRFATAIWDLAPKVPILSIPMGVITKILQLPPPLPKVPTLFDLASPGILEQAFREADFSNIQTTKVTVIIKLSSTETYINFLKDVCTPVITLVAQQTIEQQVQIWQNISEVASKYIMEDGSVSMANEAICVVGTKQ